MRYRPDVVQDRETKVVEKEEARGENGLRRRATRPVRGPPPHNVVFVSYHVQARKLAFDASFGKLRVLNRDLALSHHYDSSSSPPLPSYPLLRVFSSHLDVFCSTFAPT